MIYFLVVVHVIVCLFLIGVVLLQPMANPSSQMLHPPQPMLAQPEEA